MRNVLNVGPTRTPMSRSLSPLSTTKVGRKAMRLGKNVHEFWHDRIQTAIWESADGEFKEHGSLVLRELSL